MPRNAVTKEQQTQKRANKATRRDRETKRLLPQRRPNPASLAGSGAVIRLCSVRRRQDGGRREAKLVGTVRNTGFHALVDAKSI